MLRLNKKEPFANGIKIIRAQARPSNLCTIVTWARSQCSQQAPPLAVPPATLPVPARRARPCFCDRSRPVVAESRSLQRPVWYADAQRIQNSREHRRCPGEQPLLGALMAAICILSSVRKGGAEMPIPRGNIANGGQVAWRCSSADVAKRHFLPL